jgi:hypothetical protein
MYDLDAAGLAASAGLDLRLDDHGSAEFRGCRLCLFGRIRDDARKYRHSVLFEKVTGLVLKKIHAASSNRALAYLEMCWWVSISTSR